MNLKEYITEIKDYPKEGINFKDITSLMLDKDAYKYSIDQIVEFAKDLDINLVVGPEARGFITGCPVAYALNTGFVPVRKPGKLPREVEMESYDLEYGSNTLCIHKEDIKKGDKVLIVDDLLATGGTIKATINILERLGAEVVGLAFLIELKDLEGKKLIDSLGDYKIKILESY